MNSLWTRIRQRKVVQWALAYLAGAWIVLQVADILGQNLGWPASVFRITMAVLSVGFLAALVLAWYHGEKGRQRVSGMEVLMLAGILVIAGAAVALVRGETDPRPGESVAATEEDPDSLSLPDDLEGQPTIAVLPFENLSSDPDNAFFADGIHEEILTLFTKVDGLRPISRTSVMRYRDSDKSLREIADELGVGTVLEGSVQRAGDRVRITVQLIDAESDTHLWAERYDRELADIFAVQSDVAEKVVSALRMTLSPTEAAQLRRRPTDDLEAYDHYVRGLYAVNTELDYAGGRDHFRRAIDRDPEFADAWAWLSETYSHLNRPSDAKSAAERALALDPKLAAGHVAHAFVLMFNERDWPAALEALDRALALNPSQPLAYQRRAYTYLALGRHEDGIADIERAFTLDPLSPRIRIDRGIIHWYAGRHDRVERAFRAALEMDPENETFRWFNGLFHLLQGRRNEAAHEFDRSRSPIYAAIARGDTANAFERLARRDTTNADPYDLAIAYTLLGAHDRALSWLERAYRERHRLVAFLAVSPLWDPLRDHPRFQALVKEAEEATF